MLYSSQRSMLTLRYRRKVTFIDKSGESHTFEVADGSNLLDIAQANDLDVEGACGGSCACSTCHVIITDQEMYDAMPEPSDDENEKRSRWIDCEIASSHKELTKVRF